MPPMPCKPVERSQWQNPERSEETPGVLPPRKNRQKDGPRLCQCLIGGGRLHNISCATQGQKENPRKSDAGLVPGPLDNCGLPVGPAAILETWGQGGLIRGGADHQKWSIAHRQQVFDPAQQDVEVPSLGGGHQNTGLGPALFRGQFRGLSVVVPQQVHLV